MIDIASPIRRALRGDGVLQAVLGLDQDGEPKIYFSVVKTDVSPPYLLVDIIPSNNPVAVYGDGEAMDAVPVALRSWAETSEQAWQLASFANEAILLADFEFEPYASVSVRRSSTPGEQPDRDTNLKQVVVLYDVILAK